jgi:aryl-phospho-beta-D-glucosidase BglC (GH1 family)
MSEPRRFLRTAGAHIVDDSSRTVALRGTCLGGCMNMENFIAGFPANEEAMRQALAQVLGPEKAGLLLEQFVEDFFTAEDAAFLESLGLNLLRLPLNYHHFEDDMQPFTIEEDSFRDLDRVVRLCADHHIYTIIDLHALPGYQNQDWHCDNPTHKAFFWQHKHFQDRAVHLWEAIADRYKNHPWVAGYDLMNEPGDPTEKVIVPFYERLIRAIRDVDSNHILFLEGNRYCNDFHMFGDPWPNTAYSVHAYVEPGGIDGGPYPGVSKGKRYDRRVLEEEFEAKCAFMLERGVPVWVGEFGPVYTGDPTVDAMRFRLLEDQLQIFADYGASWAIWTYKDIGLQGLVYTAPECAWLQRLRPVLEKKARLGVDTWGSRETLIQDIIQPLERTFAEEFPGYTPFPFGARFQIERLVRGILLAEPLLPEFADCFRNLEEEAFGNLTTSFRLENCIRRSELLRILSVAACRP